MQLFGQHLEDFIKIHIINGDTKKSPLVVHLNLTGYDVESLATLTCIRKSVIQGYISLGSLVPELDCNRFDHAFQLPIGTFRKEYSLWKNSLQNSNV